MKRLIFISIFLSLLCGSCSKRSHMDAKFDEIDMLCDSNPRLAISMLDSLDYDYLPENDRHRYDLLSIKSRDKAYERHTSDSLILDVIAYYQSHQKSGHYPEALYYGGRVYSDIGDLPTALEYFQMALDATPDNNKTYRSKRLILSQAGRLLEELRLHNQARPYIEKSIAISKYLNDSAGIFYDNLLLLSILRESDSLHIANSHLQEAIRYSHNMPTQDIAWLNIEKALLLLHEEKADSALLTIKPMFHSVDSLCRNYALVTIANIYKKTGQYDTVCHYAKELALSSNLNNRISGFKILFSPEVFPRLPKDSIDFFIQAYGRHLDSYLNRHESQNALLQNTKYNYSLHQRQRERAIEAKLEAEKNRNVISIVCSAIILILIVVIFRTYHTNIKIELKLMLACQLAQNLRISHKIKYMPNANEADKYTKYIEDNKYSQESEYFDFIEEAEYIEDLEEEDKKPRQDMRCIEDHAGKRLRLPFVSQKARLRKELLELLHEIIDDEDSKATKNNKILNSSIVMRLRKMLVKNKGIHADDQAIWLEIEKTVHSAVPEFKSRLMILSLDQMSKGEYHVALLTRCGFRPKEISDLLCLGKSASSDRRRNLAKKIFQSQSAISDLDRLIFRL